MGARAAIAVLIVVATAGTAGAQRGVPQGGFPSWQERMLLVYVNRSRADPAADLAGCTVCAEKACYATPLTPVAHSYPLNRASRFHSANLELTAKFQHDSPCALVTDLANQYVPAGTCNGEVACACVGGTLTGTTTAVTRTNRFLAVSAWGENIAYGYATPRQTFYQWLWEAETSATCGFRSTNGHRYNILEPSRRLLGNGYYRISRHMWAQDFNGGSNPTGTLLAGGHEPQFTGGTVEFRVNYFDSGAPTEATVNVDGACSAMTRERGGATNATYLASQALGGTTCRRYRFEFKAPGGTVYLPEVGSYGVGGSGTVCDDWNMSTPSACGAPPNQTPMVATAAAANPAPVTATTTALSVLGSDDGGEAALTYTWAATGPAAVTFSANGTNAAKATTATFARAGAYTFTVTLRDAANQTSTSTVNVTVDQTLTALAVSPPTASVPAGSTQQFAGTGYDQFAMSLTAQPAKTWTVAGGGTIDATGKFTADATTGGPYTVTATAGGKSGTAQVSVTGPNAPMIAAAATATPSPITGTTTTASVIGASGGGEAALVYTWTASGPAPVTVAPNGTNAAKTAVITFAAAGNYTLTAQIKDAQNQTATSSVDVVVAATPTTVDISPRTAVVVVGTTKDFAAAITDQFGKPAATAPAPMWTTTGGGTIDAATGRFTAGTATGGPFTLTATSGAAAGTAQIVVAEMEDTTPPSLTITSPADGAELADASTMITTDATDDLGIGRVVITVAGEDHELLVSPWQHLWDTSALADGTYTIEARAYDLAGNPSTPVAITVLVHPGAKDGGGCGCASSSPRDGVWLLLALLALRRRRR